jgi:hypothetical protein
MIDGVSDIATASNRRRAHSSFGKKIACLRCAMSGQQTITATTAWPV